MDAVRQRYRDGKLELEGFPVADISDYLADGSVTIWLDLRGPDRADLAVLSEEFGLHPLAVEAALRPSQRPKLDRYRSHLLLTAYGTRLDTGTGELTTSEIAAFITSKALITVRRDDGLDIDAVVERCNRDERALPRVWRKSRLRRLHCHHCPDRAGALRHLQTQGLAVGPKIARLGRTSTGTVRCQPTNWLKRSRPPRGPACLREPASGRPDGTAVSSWVTSASISRSPAAAAMEILWWPSITKWQPPTR